MLHVTRRVPDCDEDVYAMLLHSLQTKTPDGHDLGVRYTWSRLAPKTRSATTSLLRKLHGAHCHATPTGLQHLLILMELGDEDGRFASSTVVALKDALARTAQTVGVFFKPGPWAAMKAAMKTYAIRNPPRRKEKGAIDLDQFRQLIELVRERNDEHLEENIAALTIEYAFGFRGSRVTTIHRSNFERVYDGQWWFHGDADKDKDRGAPLQRKDTMKCLRELNSEVDDIMASLLSHDDNVMFPFFRVGWCTMVVKEAAAKFGWNDMLDWTGSHCLRHGSAMVAAGPNRDVAAAADHLSTSISNAHHYSRDVNTRVAQTIRNQAGEGGPPKRGRKTAAELAGAKAVAAAVTPKPELRKRPWTPEYTRLSDAARRRAAIARSANCESSAQPTYRVIGWND